MLPEVFRSERADEMTETEFKNAAWYYPEPKEKAKNIKDYVAFCEYFVSYMQLGSP